MRGIMSLSILAVFAVSCGVGPRETAETRRLREDHVAKMEELEVKREETLTTIRTMEFPALISLMEEDAERGVEPFNSVAYREVTTGRRDGSEALFEHIDQQKAVTYLPLLALRDIDPVRFADLDAGVKLNTLLSEFGRSSSYNKWGLPHLYWEDAAWALVELGKAAEPGLKKYLKDQSPAPVWGSEEVQEYEAYQYRRCDYALALLMEIRGQSVKELPRSRRERDALIAEIN